MRVYISGPMTGLPDCNRPAFNEAAGRLRELGHDVINPVELDGNDSYEPGYYEEYLARDLKEILNCDAIFMLDGWQGSHGAKLERAFGKLFGLTFLW